MKSIIVTKFFGLFRPTALALAASLAMCQGVQADDECSFDCLWQEDSCTSWWCESVCPGTGAFGGDSCWAASLSFNHDNFFGSYTTGQAAFMLNDTWDITFYSILWHNDALGTTVPLPPGVIGTGFNPWTEFGAGVNYKAMDGALNINPQLGVLNGDLQSANGQPTVFEGIVPNLTINYDGDNYESEFYMGYYLGIRGASTDFLHWWTNAGVKPWGDACDWRQTLSFGAHFEHLRAMSNATGNIYAWAGPYAQVALPNGLSMRYTAGWNLANTADLGREFYKVNLVYDF